MGGIPTLYKGGRGSKAQAFEYCAMSVIFENCPGATIDEDERFHYVVAYDDLGSFCQALLYLDAMLDHSMGNLSDITFEVTIHDQFNEDLSIKPRPNSAQRRLLEPFASLHSMRKFTIKGHVNTEYANTVIARLTIPALSVEETVDRVMFMTREARSFSNRGHHAQAIDKYKSATVQTFTRCLNPGNTLQKGPLAGRTESFAFRYLDFMLTSKIAMCHAKLDEWEEAHYWACDATCTKFFPTEHAEIIYKIAWVVDAESNKALQVLETFVEKLTVTEDLHIDRDLSALENKMRSKKGMDSLRDLKAVMKRLADRDWAGDSNQE